MKIKSLITTACILGLSSIANAAIVSVTYTEYTVAGVATGQTFSFDYDDAGPAYVSDSLSANGGSTLGAGGSGLTNVTPGGLDFFYTNGTDSIGVASGVVSSTTTAGALGGEFAGFTVGNVFVAAVPEPSSTLLLGLGGLGLILRRRKN